MAAGQVRLKDSVYAIEAPIGGYIAARGREPRLQPLHLATICPVTSKCLDALAKIASQRLAGIPHEIVRVDA